MAAWTVVKTDYAESGRAKDELMRAVSYRHWWTELYALWLCRALVLHLEQDSHAGTAYSIRWLK